MKKICPRCGVEVSAQNLSRHLNRCNGDGFGYYKKITPPENLSCPFCGKLCKNLNSYRQHSVRCKSNPDRKAFDSFSNYIRDYRKGQTANTCPEVAKQVKTVKDKYKNGFVSPVRGRKIIVNYLYQQHNEEEIGKWLYWLNKQDLATIQYLDPIGYWEGYAIVYEGNGKGTTFQQNHVMKQLLGDNYPDGCTVHHINKNRSDNNIYNLMVFDNSKHHKQFHYSKYAYLTYNEDNHLFSCEIIKN